jgi:hypothetical protein
MGISHQGKELKGVDVLSVGDNSASIKVIIRTLQKGRFGSGPWNQTERKITARYRARTDEWDHLARGFRIIRTYNYHTYHLGIFRNSPVR